MKKQFRTLAAFFFCGLTFAACSDKENNDNDEFNTPKTYTLTINASKGENAGLSKALALDGNTLNATWKKGEVVTVYHDEDKIGELTAQSDGVNTELSGEFTGENYTPAVNDQLLLKFNTPDYTGQDGTLDYIAAHCDYATALVGIASVTNGQIIPDQNANFQNQQAIVKFTLKNSSGEALTVTSSSVTIGNNTYNFSTNEFYLAVPSGSDNIEITANDGTFNYTKTASNSFTNGNFYNANVAMTKIKLTATTTAPTANTLTFNGNQSNVAGSAQELITEGTTNGGEWQYKLGADGEYSTAIPTATNAGEYTVYYKLVGGDDYEDIEEQSFTVSIAKANGFVVLSPSSDNNIMWQKIGGNPSATFYATHHGGTLTYATSSNSLNISQSGTRFTVSKSNFNKQIFSETITITSAATTNYKAATAVFTIRYN